MQYAKVCTQYVLGSILEMNDYPDFKTKHILTLNRHKNFEFVAGKKQPV